jgi:hypothetical protein
VLPVDGTLAGSVRSFCTITVGLTVRLVSIVVFSPVFLIPSAHPSLASGSIADATPRRGLVILVIGWRLGSVYMKAQLSVKREQSNAKAPVIGVFSGAIAGLSERIHMITTRNLFLIRCTASIRAYGAERLVRQRSIATIDRYTQAARTFYNLNRWRVIMFSVFALHCSEPLFQDLHTRRFADRSIRILARRLPCIRPDENQSVQRRLLTGNRGYE